MLSQLAEQPPDTAGSGMDQHEMARPNPVHLAHEHLRRQALQQNRGGSLLADVRRKTHGERGR